MSNAETNIDLYSRITALAERVKALEHNLQATMSAAGVAWSEPPANHGAPPEVVEAIRAGNKMEAIKLTRQATGIGLAEAQAAVEELEAQLGGQ